MVIGKMFDEYSVVGKMFVEYLVFDRLFEEYLVSEEDSMMLEDFLMFCREELLM